LSWLISVIGVGYVGLCTSLGFTAKSYKTTIYDNDKSKLNLLRNGLSPFFEPNLEKYLQDAKQNKLFVIANRLKEAINTTNLTFIAVGTPSKKNGPIDLKYIKQATKQIGKALKTKKTYHLIVIKSTVTPGTTVNIVKPLLQEYSNKKCGQDFGLCMNPEFLSEGTAINDTLNPYQIIIGENDKKSGDALEAFYKQLHQNTVPIIRTNLSTAELIKYANNAFLATKISYINTIANICEKIPRADVQTVAKAIGLDNRISPKFLRAGLGYGGSCFPKDLQALIVFSKQKNYKPTLLEATQKVNNQQINHTINLIKKTLGNLSNKTIAILGLSFKPHTNDMREARSTPIIKQLLNQGAKIKVYDPKALPNAKQIFKNQITYAKSAKQCITNTDCTLIVTEWPEFKKLQPPDFIKHMKQPILIDARRIYDPQKFTKNMKYLAIGLGKQ